MHSEARIVAPVPNPPFVDHCLELLSLLGPTRARRMFGGWGLYADEVFVALIIGERLYLKTDASTREAFTAAGCEPFVYRTAAGHEGQLGYWSAPDEALESPAAMAPWARLALQAAVAARSQAGSTGRRKTAKSVAAATPRRPRR